MTPWWGWLIIGVAVMVAVTWVTVATVGFRAWRRIRQGMDADFPRPRTSGRAPVFRSDRWI